MVAKMYEDVHLKLVTENTMLKDAFQSIQREIGEMLAVRKEVFMRRKKIEFG